MNTLFRQGLPWPVNKPRHRDRKVSAFKDQLGGKKYPSEPSVVNAADRVTKQVSAFTRAGQNWRTNELTIWSYAPNGKRGGIISDRPSNPDPGVVATFDLDGTVYTIACDRYTTIAGNLCAVAAYIDGLRAQERHGVASLGEMLAGHLALPSSASRPWAEILGVDPRASKDEIKAAYRKLVTLHHPDQGGNRETFERIQAAYEEALS